jgi:hypothetical protein
MSATASEGRMEVLAAIQSLARAASIFRDAFTLAAEGFPMPQILATWGDPLAAADDVINRWAASLELDAEPVEHRPGGADEAGGGTKRSGPGWRKAARPRRRPGPPT